MVVAVLCATQPSAAGMAQHAQQAVPAQRATLTARMEAYLGTGAKWRQQRACRRSCTGSTALTNVLAT